MNAYTFYTNPSTFVPVVGDPRFVINYDVYESTTNIRPPWIIDYDQVTRLPTISTTIEALEGTYTLYIVAWFAYRP